MFLTNLEVLQVWEPLQKLMAEKLPIKVSYRLSKLAQKLGDQHKLLDGLRNKLINDYGEANDKGQMQVSVDSPNWNVFESELTDLLEGGIELDIADRITLPDKDIKIEAATLLALDKFINLDE